MKEIIKPIFNYDGYFISNLGKVYCNIGKGGKNTNRKELYEIKPSTNSETIMVKLKIICILPLNFIFLPSLTFCIKSFT